MRVTEGCIFGNYVSAPFRVISGIDENARPMPWFIYWAVPLSVFYPEALQVRMLPSWLVPVCLETFPNVVHSGMKMWRLQILYKYLRRLECYIIFYSIKCNSL